MLIERIYEKYQQAKKKYAEKSKLEGFYGSELETAAKNGLSFFAFLFYFAIALFLFLMLPIAIYYIIIYGKHKSLHWSVQILLIFSLFLPNVGFILTLFIIGYGFFMYGMPNLRTVKKRFKYRIV